MMHVGDTMSTSEDVQCIGGSMSTLGWGTMSTLGDTMDTLGGYHEYIGGISLAHRGIS